MKHVYGVEVDDGDYELVLKIAGLLWGHSPLSYAEKGIKDRDSRGHQKCAEIALKAVLAARNLS